jgi:hypothetical protein
MDNDRHQKEIQVRLAALALARAWSMVTGTVRSDLDQTPFSVEGSLPENVLGEVRVQQRIYKFRGDVGALCRVIPPHDMTM